MVMKVLYIVLAMLIIGGYAWAGYRGLELSTAKKGMSPAGMRGAGGPRVFWTGGYRGGK